MTLKEVLRAIPAMERDGVSKVARGKQESTQTREGFVEAYIATNGSINAMTKRLTGRNNHESWSDRRDQFVSRHLEQMRKGDTYNNGWLPNGEPTRRHLGLMAWAYTPSPKQNSKVAQNSVERLEKVCIESSTTATFVRLSRSGSIYKFTQRCSRSNCLCSNK